MFIFLHQEAKNVQNFSEGCRCGKSSWETSEIRVDDRFDIKTNHGGGDLQFTVLQPEQSRWWMDTHGGAAEVTADDSSSAFIAPLGF